MRVGFVTQLLWSRYGPFWQKLVAAAGAEVVMPAAERVAALAEDPRLASIPGLCFALAAAEALSLGDVDHLIVPQLNPETETARGSAQDPWIASFPEALTHTVTGLPPLLPVPATLGPEIEGSAVAALTSLIHDAAAVRRLWQRFRASARTRKHAEVRWAVLPSRNDTVGVVGQPWLLREPLIARVVEENEHAVAQHQFDPASLRAEGHRVDPQLLATDAEVLGAARLFARRGSVKRLRVLADADSGADAWLVRRIQQLVHKPVSVHYLQEVLPPAELRELLLRSP